MTEKEYRQVDAISQSYLTLLDQHPSKAKAYLDGDLSLGDIDEMKIGDAVDTLLTKSEEEFNKNFEIISDDEKPTGQIYKMVNYIYKGEDPTDVTDANLEKAYNAADIKKYSFEKMRDRFFNEGKPYLDKINSSKTILTKEQLAQIKEIEFSVKFNEFTSPIILDDRAKFQIPVFFRLKNTDCKGLLDICIFDEVNKIIYPYDLKITSYSLQSFDKAIYSKRYDLQADFYYHGLRDNYPDYKIAPFQFIVENMNYPGKPVIYKYNPTSPLKYHWLEGVWRDNRYYKGVNELIDEHKFHMEHDRWDYKKEVLENEGVIEIS